MAALASKQAEEEAELLNKSKAKQSSSAPSSPTDNAASEAGSAEGDKAGDANGGPARSKSGTDLKDFGRQGSRFGKARVDAANGQSANGARRHSGDVGGLAKAMTSLDMKPQPSKDSDARHHVGFLFDDELEADLNSAAKGLSER